MIQYPSYMTQVETVMIYLLPVDYVRLISSCRYLHEKCRKNIPDKRRESLVRFTSDSMEHYAEATVRVFVRGHKLPNDELEGMREEIWTCGDDTFTFERSIYDNGRLLYTKSYNIGEKEQFSVFEEFTTWKDIDADRWFTLCTEGNYESFKKYIELNHVDLDMIYYDSDGYSYNPDKCYYDSDEY